MPLVGTGLDCGVDDAAAGTSELGRGDVGFDAELLNGVRSGEEDNSVDQRFVVVEAVEQKVVCLRTKSVDRQSGAAAIVVAIGFGVAAVRPWRRRWCWYRESRPEPGLPTA